MPTKFPCRGCGQVLELPDGADTPMVICPRCGELLAVREEPRPVEIPERPEQSEAVTPSRPPDRQDVMTHQPTYRSPFDSPPQSRMPRPGLRNFVTFVLCIVLPVGLICFLAAGAGAFVGRAIEGSIFGWMAVLVAVLTVFLLDVWFSPGSGRDERSQAPGVGCVWVLGVQIILLVTGMLLLLTVCKIR
jgi:hypothetical protein